MNTLQVIGENAESVPIRQGEVVAFTGSRQCLLASAGSVARCPAIGFASEVTLQGQRPIVATAGFLELRDWRAATGSILLLPRAVYFLDIGYGHLTLNPSGPAFLFAQRIGCAISETVMHLEIDSPILL